MPAGGDLRLSDHAADPHRRRPRRDGAGRANSSNCEFINVECEFAALSVAIGASAAGARAYTATASQGLLFMAEAVYNASGLGLPIVMTLGNRAIGAPINIWNDHSDAMSMRDAGWMQLFAETNQEAVDLHIQAFRLAEELSMPVMVCVDGFILTHAVERIDIPEQAEVDAYLPPYEPVQVLDPAEPDLDRRHGRAGSLHRGALPRALQADAGAAPDRPNSPPNSRSTFGRDSGGLLRTYRADDAELLVVAMGSVNGTIKDTIDEMRAGRRRASASSRSSRSGRSRPRRCARCWSGAQRRRGDREEHRRRHGRAARQQCRPGAAQPAERAAGCIRSVAGLGGRADHAAIAARTVPPRARAAVGRHAFPRPQRARSSAAKSIRSARCAAPVRRPRTSCADLREVARRTGRRVEDAQ